MRIGDFSTNDQTGFQRLVAKCDAIRFTVGKTGSKATVEWFLSAGPSSFAEVLRYALTGFSSEVTSFLVMGGVLDASRKSKGALDGAAWYETAVVALKLIGAANYNNKVCDRHDFVVDDEALETLVRKAKFLSMCLDTFVNTHNMILRAKRSESSPRKDREVGEELLLTASTSSEETDQSSFFALSTTSSSLRDTLDKAESGQAEVCPKILVEPEASGNGYWTAEDQLPEHVRIHFRDADVEHGGAAGGSSEWAAWDCFDGQAKELFPFDDSI